nr:metal-dependent transcriptional regulator [Cryptosporangium arvum]
MSELFNARETYLRVILELEESIVPLRARIAERVRQSGPTVSETVARMERDGLLTVQVDRRLELTEPGRRRAVTVLRKRRLAELMLVNIIGLTSANARAEAGRWEHVLTTEAEGKVHQLLGRPHLSLSGNPIPGLADLARHPGKE